MSLAAVRESLATSPMGKEALAAHMLKVFPEPKDPVISKDSIFPQDLGTGAASELFKLDPEVLVPDKTTTKKTKKDARKAPLNETPPAPTLLVEYLAELTNGVPIKVPEYAHLVKVDGETLLLAFPISKQERLKPLRSTEIQIKTSQGTFLAFCTGIHTDIAEWGLSLSIYLIKEIL